MKRLVMTVFLLTLMIGLFSGCPTVATGGLNYVNPFTIHYYQSSWVTPYIHFNNGVDWTFSPGESMVSEGNNWWNYIVDTALGTTSITAVFNDGDGSWDNNGGNDYTISDKEIWLINGYILTNDPTLQTHEVIIHYKKSDIFSGTPTLTIWEPGKTATDVSSVSNDANGNPVYVVNKSGGLTYAFNFKEGATTETTPSIRYISTLLSDKELWVWKQHRAVFESDPGITVIADPGVGITNNMGATISGGNVNFVLYSGTANSVGLSLNGGAQQELKLTSDAKYWWAQIPAIAGDTYSYWINGTSQVADPYSKANKYSNGDSIIIDPSYAWTDAAYIRPSNDELIIYEMHVKDFTSHTSSGVVNKGKYAGLIEKIPYLTNLGVNAVEFMPVNEVGDGGYSWGYNPSLYFAPESYMASANTGVQVQELQALIEALHNAGIAVIMDVVYNHVGPNDNHFWGIDSLYYFDYDEDGILEDPGDDSSPWGIRFATGRPLVKRLMYDNMKYFMDYYHVDGFRLDSTENTRIDSVIDVVDTLRLEGYSDRYFIFEEFNGTHNTAIKSFNNTVGSVIISSWGTAYKNKVWEGINNGTADLGNISYYSYGTWNKQAEAINYFSSHDEGTLAGHINASKKEVKLAATHLLTAMGIPMLWMGDEFMRIQYGNHPPVDIDGTSEQYNTVDWSLAVTHADLIDFFKNLISLRKNHESLRMTVPNPDFGGDDNFDWQTDWDGKLIGYVYKNISGDNNFMVLNNYGSTTKNYTVEFPNINTWYIMSDGNTNVSSAPGLSSFTISVGTTNTNITIPAQTSMIFMSQDVNP